MADRYSSKISSTDGITPEQWYNQYMLKASFQPATKPQEVLARGANGYLSMVPIEHTAICFNQLKMVRNGVSKSSHGGGGGNCVEGTPHPELVILNEAFRFQMSASPKTNIFGCPNSHPVVKQLDGIFPLGIPTNDNARVVFHEMSAKWVSMSGEAITHHPDHIANMMMSAIKSILFSLSKASDQKSQRKLFCLAVFAIQTAKQVMWTAIPESYNLIPPLVQDKTARDSLQRFVALTLCKSSTNTSDELNRQTRHYEVLEMMLKRLAKYEASSNWSSNPPHGLFACFLITPLVNRAIEENVSYEDALGSYNKQLSDAFTHIGDLKKTHRLDVQQVNVEILRFIIRHDNLTPLQETNEGKHDDDDDDNEGWTTVGTKGKNHSNHDQKQQDSTDPLTRFYQFCMNPQNYSKTISYVEWKLINIKTGDDDDVKLNPLHGVFSDSKVSVKLGIANVTPLKISYPVNEEHALIQHSCPTQWGVFSFDQEGKYTIQSSVIGNPKVATGDSRNDEQVANLRVTVNNEKVLFHNRREAFSSAGSHFHQMGAPIRLGRWDYEYISPLNLYADIHINVQPILVSIQQGDFIISLPRHVLNEPIVVGIKYMNLKIFKQTSNPSVELSKAIEHLKV